MDIPEIIILRKSILYDQIDRREKMKYTFIFVYTVAKSVYNLKIEANTPLEAAEKFDEIISEFPDEVNVIAVLTQRN